MAILLAIKQFLIQFLLRRLLKKIPTVIVAGVGQFPLPHDRAVLSCKFVVIFHESAVVFQWIWCYLKRRFWRFYGKSSNPSLPHKSPLRFYLFRFIMADNIRRALQNIDLGIDDAPFTLPSAIVQQAANENRFCLIGRPLMPRKQNLRQLMTTLPRSWGLTGFVRGRIVENRRFQFVFPSEESLETVLRRGPWSYAERMLVLQRWSPDMDPQALNFIPFWIQIRGIPLQFMNLGIIDSIAGSLGVKMETDFDEVNVSRVQFVRVRVSMNVSQPLRFQRNYQFSPGENTVISFFYERLRGFCAVCGMMTHDSGSCLLQNGGLDNSDGDDNDENDEINPLPHGNPGVQIHELGEDGQPIVENDEAENLNPQDQDIVEPEDMDQLSDIDPNHNALEGISSGEWAGDEMQTNIFPCFVNESDPPSAVELLDREFRKRKQADGDEENNSRKKKSASEFQSGETKVEEGSSSGENARNDKCRAAVGPVPPPVP